MGGLKLWFLCWLFLAATAICHGGGPWSWLNPEISSLESGIDEQTRRLEVLPAMPAPQPLEHAGFHSGFAPKEDSVRWVQVDLGEERALDEIRLIPAHPCDDPERPGSGFPVRFTVEADGRTLFHSTGGRGQGSQGRGGLKSAAAIRRSKLAISLRRDELDARMAQVFTIHGPPYIRTKAFFPTPCNHGIPFGVDLRFLSMTKKTGLSRTCVA